MEESRLAGCVAAAQAGDAAERETLLGYARQVIQGIFEGCRRAVQARTVDDLYQVFLIRVDRGLAHYQHDNRNHFQAWVSRIARNVRTAFKRGDLKWDRPGELSLEQDIEPEEIPDVSSAMTPAEVAEQDEAVEVIRARVLVRCGKDVLNILDGRAEQKYANDRICWERIETEWLGGRYTAKQAKRLWERYLEVVQDIALSIHGVAR